MPALLALAWHGLRVGLDPGVRTERVALLVISAGLAVGSLLAARRSALGPLARPLFAAGVALLFWLAALECMLLTAGIVLALGFLGMITGGVWHVVIACAALRPRGPHSRGARIASRLGVLACSVSLAVCGLEAALAHFFPRQVYEIVPDDPQLGAYLHYRGDSVETETRSGRLSMPYLQPDFRGQYMHPEFPGIRVEINSLGMRDAEANAAPLEPGDASVLVLGDSFTFGTGVDLDETFCHRLAARAPEITPRRLRMFNGGVPGMSPLKELVMLRAVAEGTRPEVVVVAICEANDLGEELDIASKLRKQAQRRAVSMRPQLRSRRSEPAASPDPPVRVGGLRVLATYLRATTQYSYWKATSATARVFEVWFEGLFLRWGLIGRDGVLWDRVLTESFRKDRPSFVGRAQQLVLESMQSIRAACAEIGASLVVLVIPAAAQAEPARFSELRGHFDEQDRSSLDRTAFHADFVRALAQDLCVVDMLPTLEQAARNGRPSYHREGHWNAAGHALAADRLVPVLEELLAPK
jgi:hypothetical protein